VFASRSCLRCKGAAAKKWTPVTLPPGRLRLATRPARTGSTPAEKTTGIVVVAAFAVATIPGHCHSVPPRRLLVIQYFSHLITSEAQLAIGQRHGGHRPPPHSRSSTPVRLPPGRARLATRPSLTGSSPEMNTMGIVVVAALAANAAAGPPLVAITATRRRRSEQTSAGRVSRHPASGGHSASRSSPRGRVAGRWRAGHL
jgi:hypothetical protein